MARLAFERDYVRAADVARDLDVPPIVATHYGHLCPYCQQLISTDAAGAFQSHEGVESGLPCLGSNQPVAACVSRPLAATGETHNSPQHNAESSSEPDVNEVETALAGGIAEAARSPRQILPHTLDGYTHGRTSAVD